MTTVKPVGIAPAFFRIRFKGIQDSVKSPGDSDFKKRDVIDLTPDSTGKFTYTPEESASTNKPPKSRYEFSEEDIQEARREVQEAIRIFSLPIDLDRTSWRSDRNPEPELKKLKQNN